MIHLTNIFKIYIQPKILPIRGVSLGLMMSEIFLGDNGACRVHGGGFAGTILAIVKDTAIDEYRRNMDKIFGDGASMILQIRHCGGVRII